MVSASTISSILSIPPSPPPPLPHSTPLRHSSRLPLFLLPTPTPRRTSRGSLVARAMSAPPATPSSAKSSTSVILVDKSDSEKVHRLKTAYLEKVVPLLKEEFSYTNIHQVPKIEKVVVNCGMGDADENSKGLEAAIKDLAVITRQRSVKTKARLSIATFKLKEGDTVGIAVTLRGNIMYSFLDRLINLGLLRMRDFQGVNPNSFDRHGNYCIGMQDQSVFAKIR